MSQYASVHLLDTPYCIDNAFDYYIPTDLRRDILCGDFVTVPFGTANRHKIGVVTALKDEPEDKNIKCKPIASVCDKRMSLSEEAQKLCFFLKEQTLCTVGDAVRAMVPASVLSRLEEVFVFCNDDAQSAKKLKSDKVISTILEYIKSREVVSLDALKTKFGPATEPSLKKLIEAELIKRDFALKNSSEKFEELCSLVVSRERAMDIAAGNDKLKLRSAKHAEILNYMADVLDDGEEIPTKQLLGATESNRAQLSALCAKGLVALRKQTVDRSLTRSYSKNNTAALTLSEEQQNAFEKLCELSDSGEPHGALLHGVTGSGKTSVMLALIDHVLKKGRSVIVLLPEIALTPQSLEIFCSRYGDSVAVIHSGLSAGERFDTHKRIKSGLANVIVGTRSAVFAPVSDLGLIIIDEEQEHTYKSDMNPKYHTRDVARFRCAYHSSLMLLASATPSFESYKKAIDGKYTLVELKHRYGNATLPSVVVSDMREEIKLGNVSPLGATLCKRLSENYSNSNQSILFINRRGYNNFISCRSCGEAIKCPECSVSMTYHTKRGSYDSGYLACHWCGKKLPAPTHCPSCGSEHLAKMGYGTQRVEQELSELLPDARILRMDTDTTGTKDSYDTLLGKFRKKEADILLGTQMVTKGHDFPDVTLVGVLLADASLYLDDYRAAERTFSMLTQVIGRAGRADKEGVAVIQTNNPDNECIKLACAQDFRTFYESEIRLRRLLVFPPFCDIALLTLSCADEKELVKASKLLADKIHEHMKGEYKDIPLMVYGPFEAPVYKVDNKYRMRMVIKCKANKRTRAMLSDIIKYFSASNVKGLSLSVDINPSNL